MQWRALVKDLLHRLGYDIVRYPLPDYLRRYGIDVVLDVGANEGQYARNLRALGYTGRIVSFEPIQAVHDLLTQHAGNDPGWQTVHLALGDEHAERAINVSGRSASSSFLDILPTSTEIDPVLEYVREETVAVRTLDEVYDTYVGPRDTVFLKIDTQGFERQVLAGAGEALQRVRGVQIEMSLVPLYAGEALIGEIMDLLSRQGFSPMWLEPGYKDPDTQQLLQVDGLFFRL